MKRVLSPVIKLTESCNLACNYCYQSGRLAPRQSMSPDTLRRIFEQLSPLCRRPVDVLWYGGEPTLVGRQAFLQAVTCAEEVLGTQVRHSLQTNGVLIDQEWAALLGQRNFRVRLSLDGPEWLHDLQRPRLGGQGSHGQVREALQILQEAGIKTRVACTVTEATLPGARELVHYFDDLGVAELDFSPALRIQGQIAEGLVTGGQFGEFLVQALEAWMGLPYTSLRIRSLSALVRRLKGQAGGYCKLEGDCSRFLTFGWDGKVYPCDEFSGVEDFCLGDIHERPLAEMLSLPLPWTQESLTRDCQECRWTSVCPGAMCPFERLMNGGMDRNPVMCDGWRALLEHLAPRLGVS